MNRLLIIAAAGREYPLFPRGTTALCRKMFAKNAEGWTVAAA